MFDSTIYFWFHLPWQSALRNAKHPEISAQDRQKQENKTMQIKTRISQYRGPKQYLFTLDYLRGSRQARFKRVRPTTPTRGKKRHRLYTVIATRSCLLLGISLASKIWVSWRQTSQKRNIPALMTSFWSISLIPDTHRHNICLSEENNSTIIGNLWHDFSVLLATL